MRIFLVFLLCFFAPAEAAPLPVLTTEGIGPFRLGMTVKEADAAIHLKLVKHRVQSRSFGKPACVVAANNHAWPGILLMIGEGDRIVLIDVNRPFRTAGGVQIGTSESRLRQLYGGRTVFEASDFDASDINSHTILLKLADDRELLFETSGNKVYSISLGMATAIEQWEGCG